MPGKSIGVMNGSYIHGHTSGGRFTPEYHSWVAMLSRCYNENTRGFKTHGAHGVVVCAGWRSSFIKFLEDMGPRPAGCTIDRKNTLGNYTPRNCRWATHEEQARNRVNTIHVRLRGVTKPLMGWCELIGVKRSAVRSKVEKQGYTYAEALTYFEEKLQKLKER